MHRLLLALFLALIPAAAAGAQAIPPPAAPGTSSNFELVAHNPLFDRGMNSAVAIYNHYAYVGNRSDGSAGRPHAGVLVLDIANRRKPTVIGEIGPPAAANVGETSRELRVWPQQRLLIVQNVGCSKALHDCNPVGPVTPTFRFFDLTGKNARQPRLLATFVPSRVPHEFVLWLDPNRPGRALLYYSVTHISTDPTIPTLVAVDISQVRKGVVTEVAHWNGNGDWSDADRAERDIFVHSLDMSLDGTRAYLAHWGGGVVVVDTSDLAANLPNPEITRITPPEKAPIWPNVGAHAIDKVFGRPLVIAGDEVYGTASQGIAPFFDKQVQGCPWGWIHLIDVSDQEEPLHVGEYMIHENTAAFCETPESQEPRASFSSHNITALRNLALVTWYAGGVRAVDISDPASPNTAGFFVPVPLSSAATEDPATTAGIHKIAMWSFPIIRNGLIYVADVRNGLYVLRYTGPHAKEVKNIHFLEPNSNVGSATRPPLDRP
jgi:hypothetical protein